MSARIVVDGKLVIDTGKGCTMNGEPLPVRSCAIVLSADSCPEVHLRLLPNALEGVVDGAQVRGSDGERSGVYILTDGKIRFEAEEK